MPQILMQWYSPPLIGDAAFASCLYRDDQGVDYLFRALVLDGELPSTDELQESNWPIEVINAMYHMIPDESD